MIIFGDALGVTYCAQLEVRLVVVDLELDNQKGDELVAESLFIGDHAISGVCQE